MHIDFNQESLELLPERAIWWAKESALLLSDIHLGKTQHFRKNGIALSSGAEENDGLKLESLIRKYQAKKLFILGDLFHSEMNREWTVLENLHSQFPLTEFILILGNHDIISTSEYEKIGFTVHETLLNLGAFSLIHDPDDIGDNGNFHLCGHLHPGVLLKGRARQSLRLPAFYRYQNTLYMPAFGSLTGLHIPSFAKKAEAFAISPSGIHSV